MGKHEAANPKKSAAMIKSPVACARDIKSQATAPAKAVLISNFLRPILSDSQPPMLELTNREADKKEKNEAMTMGAIFAWRACRETKGGNSTPPAASMKIKENNKIYVERVIGMGVMCPR